MAIRYSNNGEIETYAEKTGKTTVHISTMGNMIEETEEHRKWTEKNIAEAYRSIGLEPPKRKRRRR